MAWQDFQTLLQRIKLLIRVKHLLLWLKTSRHTNNPFVVEIPDEAFVDLLKQPHLPKKRLLFVNGRLINEYQLKR
jgi:hypothetical protein